MTKQSSDLPLRSEAAETFIRVVTGNLKSDGVSTVIQAMVEEADKACARYDAQGQKQAGGTVKKSYYRFINALANEAAGQGLISIPTSLRRRIVSAADEAREEPPTPPLPEDEFEAALVQEIGTRTPAPSPRGEVQFEQGELDEIELQLQIEMDAKRRREEYAAFAEASALGVLEELKAIAKPGDFFRQLPRVFKQPDPPRCASSYFSDNAFIVLPSATFQYQGKTITRNCAVNKRTVKVGHPLGFKMPDGSHLIRSEKREPGKEERWVKVVKYQNGMLIRYFTHIEDQDAPKMRWHGVVRDGDVVAISEAEYHGLEAKLSE